MNEPFLILLVLSFIDLIPLSSDIRRGGGGGGGGGDIRRVPVNQVIKKLLSFHLEI